MTTEDTNEGVEAATDQRGDGVRLRLIHAPLFITMGTVATIVGLFDLNPPIALGISVVAAVAIVRIDARIRAGRRLLPSGRLRALIVVFAILVVGFFAGFLVRGLIARYTDLPLPPSIRIGKGYAQMGSRGSDTFLNPHNASGVGPRIEPGQVVRIGCKLYDPTIESVKPDGYWYRLMDEPWNGKYYAPANTFWNGDVPGRLPYAHNTDFDIPDC